MTRTEAPDPITAALERLARAASAVEAGWIPREWALLDPAEPGTMTMSEGSFHFQQVGLFDELSLAADTPLLLTTRLDLPETLHGVPLAGEPLQLTLNSLRPVDLFHDGRRVFGDALPVVASGPALIEVVAALRSGDNGEFRMHVLPSPVPLDGDWAQGGLTVNFTTPALVERFQLIDLAHARLLLAQAFASTAEQRASVAAAAQEVPQSFDDLPTSDLAERLGDQARLSGMAGHLSWLDDALQGYRIHGIGHSHIDLAWLWTYDDAREVIFRDMRSVLDLFDDYPEFRFTHSQARGFAELEQSEPELFARVRARIDEGRLEPATMQWVEADVNLPSGVAQQRQLTEGVGYSLDHLGVTPRVFLAPDTFGHAGNLPQLAVQAGAGVYYHHRANPGFESPDAGYRQGYWWVGDDGTRILGVSTPVYLGPVTASRLARDLIALGPVNGIREISYFYGVGDHGGGPTRADLDAIRSLGAARLFPAVQCSTVDEYATALIESGAVLPEFHGESARLFEGCYVTHADGKSLNRQAENALTSAETLAAVVNIDAAAELSRAWRAILHHQFHDILGGSAIAAAFDDQRADADAALATAADVVGRATARLQFRAPEGGLLVTNPLAVARRDLVTVAKELRGDATAVTTRDGRAIASQVTENGDLLFFSDLGSLGTREYVLSNAARSDATTASPFEVESVEPVSAVHSGGAIAFTTPSYRGVLHAESGIILSLARRSDGKQLSGRGVVSPESPRQTRADLGLGALVLTHELPHGMTAWVVDQTDIERTLIDGARTRVVESGAVRLVFETTHAFGASSAVLRTVFYADEPWIDYELVVDWNEIGTPAEGVPGLSISFGTRERAVTLATESPFGVVEREADGYLSPVLRWADLGSDAGGLIVANDGKYGIDALGPRLRMHVVRSAYDPDPVSDAGKRDVSRYRILPHDGPWQDADPVTLAAGLNQPLIPHIATGVDRTPAPTRTYSRPRVTPGSVVIATVQPTENGHGLVRLYESQGVECSVVLSGIAGTAEITDSLGRSIPGDGRRITGDIELEFRPFEIKTVRLR